MALGDFVFATSSGQHTVPGRALCDPTGPTLVRATNRLVHITRAHLISTTNITPSVGDHLIYSPRLSLTVLLFVITQCTMTELPDKGQSRNDGFACWTCPCMTGHAVTLRLVKLRAGGIRVASSISRVCADATRCSGQTRWPGFAVRF